MLGRILAIASNTYREAVRARLLLAVFAVALATGAYSLVVGAMSLHQEERVVADLGAASISLYAVIIAIVLGSTSLHRELSHRTIFPILTRPIRRWEYLVGKYVGALLTVGVFIAVDAGAVLSMTALEAGQTPLRVGGTLLAALGLLAALTLRARHTRVFVVIPWSLAFAAAAWATAGPALDDRQLVLASATLSLCEVAIVAALATFFSSFSSPVLTAAFTAMLFVIGRSSDTLAHLPVKLFGPLAAAGRALARVVPNLHVYVPARTLLLGHVPSAPVWPYVARAALHAVFYAAALLAAGTLAFRKRDFA
jgi:Cu-processing system permease protein